MSITDKSDWFNDYLSKKGLLVSSHSSIKKYLDYEDEDYDISVRFIGNVRIGYDYLLIIITNNMNSFTPNQKLKILIDNLSCKFKKNIYTLVLPQQNYQKNQFLSAEDGLNFYKHDIEYLQNFFHSINNSFTEDIGTSKEENKSINDNFQQWTRLYLSKYITINDFDALSVDTAKLYILELKRVEEDINTWLPYLDDYGNYIACDTIIKSLGLDLNHFRTIAYNVDNKENVAICILFSIDRKEYKLFKEISTLDSIFKMPKYYESKNIRVKK